MMPADPSNVERAVSRTLRDSLEHMQRNAKELDQAVADFVAACASNRPANALPSMLRAQTASASLSATLEVLSRFVTSALQPGSSAAAEQLEQTESAAIAVEPPVPSEPSTFSPAQLAEREALEIQDSPTAPEPTEWSEAHESHDAPVQAEPFEAEQPEQVEQPEPEPQIQIPETQHAEVAHASNDFGTESLAVEPPPDPALQPALESALSPEISAKPDVLEPIADWSAPEQQEEPAVSDAADGIVADDDVASIGKVVPDGIVDEAVPITEAAEAIAIEESRIIEDAIAGGIAKLSDMHNAQLEAARADLERDLPEFDLASLPQDERELHRRASRVAKVSMQDIKLLQPQQVAIGRENKDLCIRLHEEIERAHKEYGRRFKPIMSHPVDYFYDWMVEILAAGDPSALGEYPYHTPALRR